MLCMFDISYVFFLISFPAAASWFLSNWENERPLRTEVDYIEFKKAFHRYDEDAEPDSQGYFAANLPIRVGRHSWIFRTCQTYWSEMSIGLKTDLRSYNIEFKPATAKLDTLIIRYLHSITSAHAATMIFKACSGHGSFAWQCLEGSACSSDTGMMFFQLVNMFPYSSPQGLAWAWCWRRVELTVKET